MVGRRISIAETINAIIFMEILRSRCEHVTIIDCADVLMHWETAEDE